jgi:hypothetical protein
MTITLATRKAAQKAAQKAAWKKRRDAGRRVAQKPSVERCNGRNEFLLNKLQVKQRFNDIFKYHLGFHYWWKNDCIWNAATLLFNKTAEHLVYVKNHQTPRELAKAVSEAKKLAPVMFYGMLVAKRREWVCDPVMCLPYGGASMREALDMTRNIGLLDNHLYSF